MEPEETPGSGSPLDQAFQQPDYVSFGAFAAVGLFVAGLHPFASVVGPYHLIASNSPGFLPWLFLIDLYCPRQLHWPWISFLQHLQVVLAVSATLVVGLPIPL